MNTLKNMNNFSYSVKSNQDISFEIIQTDDLFDITNNTFNDLKKYNFNNRRLVFIDRNIVEFYFKKIQSYLDHFKYDFHIVQIDSTELHKNLDTLIYVLKEIEKFGILRRSEPIIAIGGGSLLDIVGLASSIYRRGVPYIKIPTTLIGLVDASVGAKTGINFEVRRNRIGSYYPAFASILDKKFLLTLPDLEISSGMGEIIKISVIKSKEIYELIKREGKELITKKFQNSVNADKIITLSAINMIEELKDNLWEFNLKRCVDFGHSFSPIIEMRSLEDSNVKSLTHGEAVSLDVLFSSIISHLRGFLSKEELNDIFNTINLFGLPTIHEYFIDYTNVLESLNDTIKHRNGNQYLPIPIQIGKYEFINDVDTNEIKKACNYMVALNKAS
jgi:3-dehydroquinate synthase